MNLRVSTYYLVFFFGFALSDPLLPQTEDLKFYTIVHGLSQSTVSSILQDHKGFMWFGTRGGLNRYDGYEFRIYKNHFRDGTTISNDRIRDILEDDDGNIWIATASGLNVWMRDTDSFVRYLHDEADSNSLGCNAVEDLFRDSRQNLWIGTEGGLDRLDTVSSRFIHYRSEKNGNSLSDNMIHMIFEDSHGNLWIGTGDGKLNILDNNRLNLRVLEPLKGRNHPFPRFTCMLEDGQGGLWIGTQNTGLLRVDSLSGDPRFKQYLHDSRRGTSLANNNIMSMLLDRQGRLWLGTENGGLDLFNTGSGIFQHYQYDPDNPSGIGGNSIWSLYQDRNGRIWIGTYDNGLSVLDKGLSRFSLYRHQMNEPKSLSHNYVSKFLEDSRGRLWIATNGGGLNIFDRAAGTFTAIQHEPHDIRSLPNNAVTSLFEDPQGRLWVSTWAGGVSVMDSGGRMVTNYSTEHGRLTSNYVQDITGDAGGRIYIASHGGGLNIYNPAGSRFIHYMHSESDIMSIGSNDCIQLLFDSRGRLWIGTEGSGLDLLADPYGDGSFVHFRNSPKDSASLSNNTVECMAEDSRGRLWIGTGNGLNCKDGQSFRVYREEDGLPGNAIQGIVEDNHGQLWITTLNGVSRFDPDRNVFRNYDVSDGLQGNEFSDKNAAYRTRNGEIYLGGKQGFNSFYPDSIRDNPDAPAVWLTGLKIFNRPVGIGTQDSPLSMSVMETKVLILSYRQSVFSLEFAALNFTHPEKNQYAYTLEGFDKTWNYAGTGRTATYTNLNPGHYLFRVKGSNNDGVWNEEGASLAITITPPFWKRAWFCLGLGAALLGAFWVFHEHQVRTHKKQNQILETYVRERTRDLTVANLEMEQQKNSIESYAGALKEANRELEDFSYSVSHDLRAPLRGMDGFSQVLLDEYADKLDEYGKDCLRRIRNASQRMSMLIDGLLKLSRLVRAEMNIRQVNLSELVQSIALDYQQANPGRLVRFVIADHLVAEGDPVLLRAMMGHLIGNAWKFTEGRTDAKIEFSCMEGWDEPVFYIRDNGCGFDMKNRDRLFEVFQQQNGTTENAGIGLATVKRIVQRHGGHIWAECEKDKGTSFYFTLRTRNQVREQPTGTMDQKA
jgi:ligand-binding sensor domain-containing protein/signal transduction histidine kinase